jgi:hypothetical protein
LRVGFRRLAAFALLQRHGRFSPWHCRSFFQRRAAASSLDRAIIGTQSGRSRRDKELVCTAPGNMEMLRPDGSISHTQDNHPAPLL